MILALVLISFFLTLPIILAFYIIKCQFYFTKFLVSLSNQILMLLALL